LVRPKQESIPNKISLSLDKVFAPHTNYQHPAHGQELEIYVRANPSPISNFTLDIYRMVLLRRPRRQKIMSFGSIDGKIQPTTNGRSPLRVCQLEAERENKNSQQL